MACPYSFSQSGETADTLAALKYAKSKGQKIISIVNVVQSSIARESDVVLPIYSGPEIGVASTKAFTTQLMTLAFLTLKIAKEKGLDVASLTNSLLEIPALISKVLESDKHIRKIAGKISGARDIMYIGRGVSYPIAMEGGA
jgi:glucosamine--fructose-6-phosphate aminotransferase (isomerizing)